MLDPETHHIDVTLANQSDKMVVAYTLECRQFDATGKELFYPGGKPQIVTYDNVRALIYEHEPDLTVDNFILPGSEGSSVLTFRQLPDAVTAKVTVLAVVYRDRTAEGSRHYIEEIFKARRDSGRIAAERGDKTQEDVPSANSTEAKEQ